MLPAEPSASKAMPGSTKRDLDTAKPISAEYFEKRDLAPGPSPTRGVETARGEAKDRTLSTDEFKALGKVLDANGDKSPTTVAALRLIALTGLRREEACALKWREIDDLGHCLRLETTKTGRSTRPIGRPALELLRSLPRAEKVGKEVEWVFQNRDNEGSAALKRRLPVCSMRLALPPREAMTCGAALAALRQMRVIATRRSANC